VRLIPPRHQDVNQGYLAFAGADLTAWINICSVLKPPISIRKPDSGLVSDTSLWIEKLPGWFQATQNLLSDNLTG